MGVATQRATARASQTEPSPHLHHQVVSAHDDGQGTDQARDPEQPGAHPPQHLRDRAEHPAQVPGPLRKIDELAERGDDRGGAELDSNSPSGVNIVRNATGADCWNGLLFIDVDPDPLFFWTGPRYEALFPSKENPFYSDIRANVQSRIESYLAQASLPAPPKSGDDSNDKDDQ